MAARYAAGDRVRVMTREHTGHCRTPYYLRGQNGVIERDLGAYRNPEQLAYHEPGLPMIELYRVRFDQADLWSGYPAAAHDSLVADIYEHWLEPNS
jgi:hypothetical protein